MVSSVCVCELPAQQTLVDRLTSAQHCVSNNVHIIQGIEVNPANVDMFQPHLTTSMLADASNGDTGNTIIECYF